MQNCTFAVRYLTSVIGAQKLLRNFSPNLNRSAAHPSDEDPSAKATQDLSRRVMAACQRAQQARLSCGRRTPALTLPPPALSHPRHLAATLTQRSVIFDVSGLLSCFRITQRRPTMSLASESSPLPYIGSNGCKTKRTHWPHTASCCSNATCVQTHNKA